MKATGRRVDDLGSSIPKGIREGGLLLKTLRAETGTYGLLVH